MARKILALPERRGAGGLRFGGRLVREAVRNAVFRDRDQARRPVRGPAAQGLDHTGPGQAEPSTGHRLRPHQLARPCAHAIAVGYRERGLDAPAGRVHPSASRDPPEDADHGFVFRLRQSSNGARLVGAGSELFDAREDAVARNDGRTRAAVGQHLDDRCALPGSGDRPRRGHPVFVDLDYLQHCDRGQFAAAASWPFRPGGLANTRTSWPSRGVLPASQGGCRSITLRPLRSWPSSCHGRRSWRGACPRPCPRPWPPARPEARPRFPSSMRPRPRPWEARRWCGHA